MTPAHKSAALREMAQWRAWLLFGVVLGCFVRVVMGVTFP